MSYYNLDKLIKIEVVDFEHDSWYVWKSEISIFGVVLRKEGFKCKLFGDDIDVPTDCVVRDNKVYRKPRLILHFEDDYRYSYIRDTMEELIELSKSFRKEGRWLVGGSEIIIN